MIEYSDFISIYPQFQSEINKKQFEFLARRACFYANWNCYEDLLILHIAHLAELMVNAREGDHDPVKRLETYESVIQYDTTSSTGPGRNHFFNQTLFGRELLQIVNDQYMGVV